MIDSILSVLVGGGLFAFIEFLVNRHDKKHDKSKEILEAIHRLSKDVEQVRDEADKRDAVLARSHILRFRDELYNNMKHTSEYFEQILDDIVTYDKYCAANPNFANGRTKAAAEFIREEYKRLFKEHKL